MAVPAAASTFAASPATCLVDRFEYRPGAVAGPAAASRHRFTHRARSRPATWSNNRTQRRDKRLHSGGGTGGGRGAPGVAQRPTDAHNADGRNRSRFLPSGPQPARSANAVHLRPSRATSATGFGEALTPCYPGKELGYPAASAKNGSICPHETRLWRVQRQQES